MQLCFLLAAQQNKLAGTVACLFFSGSHSNVVMFSANDQDESALNDRISFLFWRPCNCFCFCERQQKRARDDLIHLSEGHSNVLFFLLAHTATIVLGTIESLFKEP